VLHPLHIHMADVFLISQLVSVAIKNALDEYCLDISIKWPNDIYWNNKKLAGILIENSLQGDKIKTVVIGVGLNVNQKVFESNAPNPVSLLQITGKRQNRRQLLQQICQNILSLYNKFDKDKIRNEYDASLYRREGYHSFQAESGLFLAKIIEVCPDGQLELETDNGEKKSFYFKEVKFIV
jgi:BirA family biotin operon repressor/biotin-[acetyl-CoA-carboxylase] ligase